MKRLPLLICSAVVLNRLCSLQETKAAGAEIVGISCRAEVAVITVVLESLMLACLAVSVILVSVVG